MASSKLNRRSASIGIAATVVASLIRQRKRGYASLGAVRKIDARYRGHDRGEAGVRVGVMDEPGEAIHPHLYGANNAWCFVTSAQFNAFCQSLRKNAGVTLLRFPGGFESESYNWTTNTLNPRYRRRPKHPGATPQQAISAMGAGNISFVLRTFDAFRANTPEAFNYWAHIAAGLVKQYGAAVYDWELGNEWYHFGGAVKHYDVFVRRYARLVAHFVPIIRQAASTLSHRIHLYISFNWARPEDVAVMRKIIPPGIWAQIDGFNIHAYSGFDPGKRKYYTAPPIDGIASRIAELKRLTGIDRVYASEWMAALNDNEHFGGIKNAAYMMQIMGQFAQAGVACAAYWPSVMPGHHIPQPNRVTLLADEPGWFPDADGQMMYWLSESFLGRVLPTAIHNSKARAIAARRPDGITSVFIAAGPERYQKISISLTGKRIAKIVRSRVMWADDAHLDIGPAHTAVLPAKIVPAQFGNRCSITLNVGGPHRGSAWEIGLIELKS